MPSLSDVDLNRNVAFSQMKTINTKSSSSSSSSFLDIGNLKYYVTNIPRPDAIYSASIMSCHRSYWVYLRCFRSKQTKCLSFSFCLYKQICNTTRTSLFIHPLLYALSLSAALAELQWGVVLVGYSTDALMTSYPVVRVAANPINSRYVRPTQRTYGTRSAVARFVVSPQASLKNNISGEKTGAFDASSGNPSGHPLTFCDHRSGGP